VIIIEKECRFCKQIIHYDTGRQYSSHCGHCKSNPKIITRMSKPHWPYKGARNPFFGNKHTEESKRKMSITKIGKRASNEAKKNMRIARIKYISINKNDGLLINPNIGRNETRILDYVEKTNNIIIKRQYYTKGYFLDGYCVETNTAYEVDEARHHSVKQKLRDCEREEYIKEKLNCKFIRLDEKEYVEKLKAL